MEHDSTGARRRALLRRSRLQFAALLGCLFAAVAQADTLLDEVRTVTNGATPRQQSLTVTQPGDLDVDALDLRDPAALSSYRVAVTRGSTVVGSRVGDGKITFTAAADDYVVRVVGVPDATRFAGSVSVDVTRAADPQPRPSLSPFPFLAVFQIPPVNASLALQSQQIVRVAATGTYQVSLDDLAFPAPLDALTGLLFDGTTLLATLGSGTPATVTLAARSPGDPQQYTLILTAQASATAKAGLIGLRVIGGPSAAAAIDQGIAVGELAPAVTVANPATQDLTLTVADLGYPSALAGVGAALTAGGRLIARQNGAGSAGAAAVASGPLQLWRIGSAGATAGSYTLDVLAGSSRLYADAQAVAGTAAGAPAAFAFRFDAPSAATYRARITDFQFPSTLQSASFAVLQAGTVLRSVGSTGSVDFDAAAGPAVLVVTAQAPASGGGLVGAEVLTSGATPTNLVDETRGVGSVFETRTIDVSAAGRYDVTLTDAGWPSSFPNLALALTRGGQLVGSIRTGGTFAVDTTPGRYLATFIATPGAAGAGLYGLSVKSSVPTATLSADAASVNSGQSVRLTWSSTAATDCTASGGWSGAKSASGSETVGPLTANATFSLVCTGPGGSSPSASTAVTVTAVPGTGGGGGGGGGAFDGLALGGLAALWALRRRRDGASCEPRTTPQSV